MTHTYALMDVSPEIYYEIRARLLSAGYDHAVDDKERRLDMEGIALITNLEHREKMIEVRKRFESKFAAVWSKQGIDSRAPTGEEYIEVCSGCAIKREGESVPVYLSAQEAIEAYENTLEEFTKDSADATLYWRIYPDIDSYQGKWKIYSRFLVSRAPMKA